ncbi:MAG: zinc ribbon domain-containing protein [Gemmatimonadales bacterium]
MVHCPKCGFEYPDQYSFCPRDGLGLVQSDHAPGRATCPSCHSEYPATYRYCVQDGAGLAAQ